MDMLLRRAFFGRHEKVYTLAFADSLDYDVGEKVEKKIQKYITMAGRCREDSRTLCYLFY
jgi:hypothetical protein